METDMRNFEVDEVVPTAAPGIRDTGKVRMGVLSPAFPPIHSEPPSVADDGKVRIGVLSPAFPPARSR